MSNKIVVWLDIVALILTAIWILYNFTLGLSNSDLLFSYLYSSVVLTAFVLTLLDKGD